ncbi:hypothetical protein SLA2020_148340 [Shorea laevis]
MEVETDLRDRDTRNNVMCLSTDPEGTPLGGTMYIPQDVGRPHLHSPIYHKELLVPVETYLEKNKVSVERIITIIYQPQVVIRIRPVNRCSSTIAGHPEAVLSVAFNPDGQHLASGSGDTIVRLWDLNTQTPVLTSTGHKNWVLCVAWSSDGKHLVSGSKLENYNVGTQRQRSHQAIHRL